MLNGAEVYGYFTAAGDTRRLRVSVDEFDRLLVALPDEGPRDLLVVAASRTPPFVWLELRTVAARPAG